MTLVEMKAARVALKKAGWTFVCSMMHSGGATGNYGLLFIKGEVEFWLNKDSFDKIPKV